MQTKQTTSAEHRSAQRAGSKAADNAPSASEERLLNVDEVARILHVSRGTIYGLIQRGDLPTVHIRRLLRFRMRDIQRFIKEQSDPR